MNAGQTQCCDFWAQAYGGLEQINPADFMREDFLLYWMRFDY